MVRARIAAVDIDEQLRFYSEAIRLKPDYAAAFNKRGVARSARGDLEGALQSLLDPPVILLS
jgi:hypothetical protein